MVIAKGVKTKEVVVTVEGFPDYVFEENYNLLPLSELENYINENKHLPEIPTAQEAEANGIGLGNINKLLLQKIEELTLYTIEQEKQIDALKKENKEIKESNQTEIEELKKEFLILKEIYLKSQNK